MYLPANKQDMPCPAFLIHFLRHSPSPCSCHCHDVYSTRFVGPVLRTCTQDFYQKSCWAHHPLPYGDFVEHKRREREAWEAARKQATFEE